MSKSQSDSTSTNVQLLVKPNIVNRCQFVTSNPLLSSWTWLSWPGVQFVLWYVTLLPNSVLDSVEAVGDTSELLSSASSEFFDVTSRSYLLPPDGKLLCFCVWVIPTHRIIHIEIYNGERQVFCDGEESIIKKANVIEETFSLGDCKPESTCADQKPL